MWHAPAARSHFKPAGYLALAVPTGPAYYPHYLALQLKVRMEGTPTPVYKRAEVHHTE